MFPLLSPLPVLIPKWRDSERHRSGCFDRLPLFTPQHKLTQTHTHTDHRKPNQPPAVSYKGDERKKQGAEKYVPVVSET